MSNVLILSENEVFKLDLADQIKHHIPDFDVTEDKDLADIIVVDEKADLLKSIEKNAPVIFLNQDDNDDIKAHSIIQKPFLLSNFLDTIKASINIFENSDEGNLEFNNYVLYPSRKEILNKRDKSVTKLTEKEVSIIKYLHKNIGKIVSKNDLMQEVWEYSAEVATHTVETHIYRLRQKVEQDNQESQLIITSEGGYQLKI